MTTSTAIGIGLTGLGGIAEITGFVKLSAELRRASGGDEYGWLRRRFHNWDVRRKGLARSGTSTVSGGGQTVSVGTAVETNAGMQISTIIVNEVPPPGETTASMIAHVLARVDNLEVLRGVMESDRAEGDRRVAGDLVITKRRVELTEEQVRAVEEQTRADLERTRAADAAEAKARAWFVVGVVLATIGGIVGNLAT